MRRLTPPSSRRNKTLQITASAARSEKSDIIKTSPTGIDSIRKDIGPKQSIRAIPTLHHKYYPLLMTNYQ